MRSSLPSSYNFANQLNHNPCGNPTPGAASCVECVSGMYFNGNIVNYNCQNKRDIYIGKYLCAHAKEIKNSLSYAYDNGFFNNLPDRITTLIIGSGPGTDIIGIDLFLGSLPNKPSFEIHQIDLINWNQQQNVVLNDIVHRGQIAVNQQSQVLNQDLKFDLIIMSYVASEININGINFIHGIFANQTNDEAVCIINDRNDQQTINNVNSIATAGRRYSFNRNTGHCNFNNIPARNAPKLFLNSTTWVFKI